VEATVYSDFELCDTSHHDAYATAISIAAESKEYGDGPWIESLDNLTSLLQTLDSLQEKSEADSRELMRLRFLCMTNMSRLLEQSSQETDRMEAFQYAVDASSLMISAKYMRTDETQSYPTLFKTANLSSCTWTSRCLLSLIRTSRPRSFELIEARLQRSLCNSPNATVALEVSDHFNRIGQYQCDIQIGESSYYM